MSNSCATCPAYVADGRDIFRDAPLGSAVCARRGVILTRIGADDEVNAASLETWAGACADYGVSFDPLRAGAVRLNWQVAQPDVAAVQLQISRRPNATMKAPTNLGWPTSCTECANFVGPDAVNEAFGFPMPLCAVKGQLIPNAKAASERAAACGSSWRDPVGSQMRGAENIKLNDQYTPNLGYVTVNDHSSSEITASTSKHSADPRSYPNEAPPVTTAGSNFEKARDRVAGFENFVRAWRQVDDPEGLREPVYLPIFDGTSLCGYDPRSTYGNHKPELYVDHMGLLYDLTIELFYGQRTPLLIGGAGTGKTEAAAFLAWLMDMPLVRINISKKSDMADLMGMQQLGVNADGHQVTEFKIGRFAGPLETPVVMLVDEPNLNATFYEAARSTFDNARQLVLDEDHGRIINLHSLAFIILAQNPSDDPLYVGTEAMNAADIDRVNPIRVELPSPDVEREIIRSHCRADGYEISDKLLDKLMQIAGDIRQQITDGALQIAWGIRSQCKVAKATQFYSVAKSYRRAITDGLDAQQAEAIMTSVSSVVS